MRIECVSGDPENTVTRRRFLKTGLALGTGLTATRGLAMGRLGNSGRPPNILVILAEDLGLHLGCYGDTQVPTPNLDRLAAQGTRFENAFVTQASCSPSRSSILTGLYPHQNGQLGLAHMSYRMQDGLPSIPSVLHSEGYATGVMGKVHVAPLSAFPWDHTSQLGHVATRDVTKVAPSLAEFLDLAADRPFFSYINLMDAHAPFVAQGGGIPAVPVEAGDVRVWEFLGVDRPAVRERVAGYYNSVLRIDYAVGRMLDLLEERGLERDTLVVFLGDHGPAFCRAKTTCYEAGLQVPLLVRWPGRVRQGQVRSELVSTVDLFPTILETIGRPVLDHLPGRSLLPLCTGRQTPWREAVFAEWTAHGPEQFYPRRSVRNARYKLIHNLLGGEKPWPLKGVDGCMAMHLALAGEAGPAMKRIYETAATPPAFELYDLELDPAEYHNLAGREDMAAVQAELTALLRAWQEETRDPIRTPEGAERLCAFHRDLFQRVARQLEEAREAGQEITPELRRKLLLFDATYDVPPYP